MQLHAIEFNHLTIPLNTCSKAVEGLGLDPKDYTVKKGRNFFRFHACAREQRKNVESAIKKHRLHKGV